MKEFSNMFPVAEPIKLVLYSLGEFVIIASSILYIVYGLFILAVSNLVACVTLNKCSAILEYFKNSFNMNACCNFSLSLSAVFPTSADNSLPEGIIPSLIV